MLHAFASIFLFIVTFRYSHYTILLLLTALHPQPSMLVHRTVMSLCIAWKPHATEDSGKASLGFISPHCTIRLQYCMIQNKKYTTEFSFRLCFVWLCCSTSYAKLTLVVLAGRDHSRLGWLSISLAVTKCFFAASDFEESHIFLFKNLFPSLLGCQYAVS